ncbi:hypothetical protein [Methylorubrum extorquens]|uniref:hypothetical protein n=1 Tax=Methylorubrum extorquens TaxID=408 RepID=UPI0005C25443|nr:hypothetical protein [Methylorubrum extorquens]
MNPSQSQPLQLRPTCHGSARPVGLGDDLAQLDGQEPLHPLRHDLRGQDLETGEPRVRGGPLVEGAARRRVQKGLQGRTLVVARPDARVRQYQEAVVEAGLGEPRVERHGVVGELREVGGPGLARELHVDDAQPVPRVLRGDGPDLAVGPDRAPLARAAGFDPHDVGADLRVGHPAAAGGSLARLQVPQTVRAPEAGAYLELALDDEVAGLGRRQVVAQGDLLEGPLVVGLDDLGTEEDPAREDVVELPEGRAFMGPPV